METMINYYNTTNSSCGDNLTVVEKRAKGSILASERNHLVKIGLQKAKQVDLRNVCLKLVNAEEGVKIPPDELRRSVSLYREFLALQYAYQDRPIVPTTNVDIIWHQHILDTRAYAADSEFVFGFFLHHYPYFGLNGHEDAQRLLLAFEETCAIWEEHFGHSPAEFDSLKESAHCRGSCSSCRGG